MLYERIADLHLEVSGYRLEALTQETAAGWIRRSTVIHLEGAGSRGVGEDITYEEPAHGALESRSVPYPLAGRWTLREFSSRLDALEPLDCAPDSVLHRRWALESAALDLALRQNGSSLADRLGRTPRPVSFVASLGLGDPPSVDPLLRIAERCPAIRFKLDYSPSWTPALLEDLAALGRVAVVDLKGCYTGAYRGPEPDPAMYRMVAEALPDVWIEDPGWDEGPIARALEPFLDRITWDAVIRSVADITRLPRTPRCLNMKPSRIGFLSEVLRAYEYCENRGIAMYGGGQFELGPGRGQIQYLASLFHPDAPNDVAPVAFNRRELPARLPDSPLAIAPVQTGFILE